MSSESFADGSSTATGGVPSAPDPVATACTFSWVAPTLSTPRKKDGTVACRHTCTDAVSPPCDVLPGQAGLVVALADGGLLTVVVTFVSPLCVRLLVRVLFASVF